MFGKDTMFANYRSPITVHPFTASPFLRVLRASVVKKGYWLLAIGFWLLSPLRLPE